MSVLGALVVLEYGAEADAGVASSHNKLFEQFTVRIESANVSIVMVHMVNETDLGISAIKD